MPSECRRVSGDLRLLSTVASRHPTPSFPQATLNSEYTTLISQYPTATSRHPTTTLRHPTAPWRQPTFAPKHTTQTFEHQTLPARAPARAAGAPVRRPSEPARATLLYWRTAGGTGPASRRGRIRPAEFSLAAKTSRSAGFQHGASLLASTRRAGGRRSTVRCRVTERGGLVARSTHFQTGSKLEPCN